MTYFIEVRRTVERSGPLAYAPLAHESYYTGFRSVYAVDTATRDLILSRGNVAGLEHTPVYSAELFLDYDSDEGVDEAVRTLADMGVRFAVFDTGRRGVHIHVPCAPMLGSSVPYSQLQFVRAHFGGAWDHTLYRHHSIFRLEGTFHEKNPGHTKRLRFWGPDGKLLEIPILPMPPPLERQREEDASVTKTPSDFWSAVLAPHQGPRTFHVYSLGALAAECGVSYDEGLAAAGNWAHTICRPPLTSERELTRVFNNGYAKGGRG